jgi:hypothetical protein
VPHALCLAGELQYLLGQGAIVAAVGMRLEADVTETSEDFALHVEAPDPGGMHDLVRRWGEALRQLAVDDPDELDGLAIRLRPAEDAAFDAEALLSGPAAAVALACAVRSHRAVADKAESTELADLATGLLAAVGGADGAAPGRHYTECLACVEGGARFATPFGPSLNVQMLLPEQSLILSIREDLPAAGAANAEQVVRDAAAKLGPAGIKASLEGEDALEQFFRLAAERLSERETAALYGLLRVSEMIGEHIERLGHDFLDHDLLAELCDEESAILEDYFDFPSGAYAGVREKAFAAGALGGKLTYAFGARPALVILTPGCRDEVLEALLEESEGYVFSPLDVDPAGAGSS